MSDEQDGPAWRGFPDVGSLIAHPEGMTVQAALDLAQMDCDVIRDDVRQEVTECKAGPQEGQRLDLVCADMPSRAKRRWQTQQRLKREAGALKVPRGTSKGKETGDA